MDQFNIMKPLTIYLNKLSYIKINLQNQLNVNFHIVFSFKQTQLIYLFKQYRKTVMKSPKLSKSKETSSKEPENVEMSQKSFQYQRESLQIKPWNSSRLAKITAFMTKKTGNNIFSLSNRTSNSNTKVNNSKEESGQGCNTYSFKSYHKPKTAPHNPSSKRQYQSNHLSQEIVKLGPVVTQQVLDDHFQQNLESINFYPQFRASVQQRKNLFLLKPYIKSNTRQRKQFNLSTFDGIQKLKTELYKGIKQSQNAEIQIESQKVKSIDSQINKVQNTIPQTNRSSVIEYMTEYTGDTQKQDQTISNSGRKNSYKASSRYRTGSISIFREKLRNKYKESKYADKIVKIKRGEGMPITIIQ